MSCPTPTHPPFGRVMFNSVTYNSLISYECNYGYMIIGNTSRVSRVTCSDISRRRECQEMRQKQGVDRTPAYLQRFVCILYICSADEYKMLSILARQSFYLICYLPSAMTGNYRRVTILLMLAVSLLCFHRVCVRSVKACPGDVTTLRGTSSSMPPYFAKKSLNLIFVYCEFL